jgi:hypothetical protein
MSGEGDEAVTVAVKRLTSMVFGSRSFKTTAGLELNEWCCFSLVNRQRSFDFVADVAADARTAFMGSQLLRSGGRAKAPFGMLLWHVARMRLHDKSTGTGKTLKSTLAEVMLAAAKDRYATPISGSLKFTTPGDNANPTPSPNND